MISIISKRLPHVVERAYGLSPIRFYSTRPIYGSPSSLTEESEIDEIFKRMKKHKDHSSTFGESLKNVHAFQRRKAYHVQREDVCSSFNAMEETINAMEETMDQLEKQSIKTYNSNLHILLERLRDQVAQAKRQLSSE